MGWHFNIGNHGNVCQSMNVSFNRKIKAFIMEKIWFRIFCVGIPYITSIMRFSIFYPATFLGQYVLYYFILMHISYICILSMQTRSWAVILTLISSLNSTWTESSSTEMTTHSQRRWGVNHVNSQYKDTQNLEINWARASRSPSRQRLLLIPSGDQIVFFCSKFFLIIFFLATRIFLPCGVVECRLMLKKLTIFVWCTYIWN